jgi:hypothetical protein
LLHNSKKTNLTSCPDIPDIFFLSNVRKNVMKFSLVYQRFEGFPDIPDIPDINFLYCIEIFYWDKNSPIFFTDFFFNQKIYIQKNNKKMSEMSGIIFNYWYIKIKHLTFFLTLPDIFIWKCQVGLYQWFKRYFFKRPIYQKR